MLANGKQVYRVPSKMKAAGYAEPPALERLNWLIHLQHIRGEVEACKDLIQAEIVTTGGKNEFLYYKQGTLLREEGKAQEALEAFQTCLTLNPDNADNVKEVAKCLYDMRRFRLALEAYLEAERITKNQDWQIYYNLGLCYMRLGDMSKAKDYAQMAVKLGKHESSFALLIKIFISEGNLSSAIPIANLAVESCPDSVNMLTESGLLFIKTGQTQHAFERLSSALALDPVCYKALLGIGCITQRHEEYDVALMKYKIAVLHAPDSVALWNNIGMCFYSKQKYVAAISCLKRALWISPLNWKVLHNLGLVHLATAQSASAFNFVCAAVNLRPDYSESFSVLGCALMELKDLDNALRAFRQAFLLAPDNPTSLLNTAICLEALGQEEEAFQLLEKLKVLMENGSAVQPQILEAAQQLEAVLSGKEKGMMKGTDGTDQEGVVQSQELQSQRELNDDEV